MNETAPHENPLVPNKKLRQIYTAIVEMRLLDEYAAVLQHEMKVRQQLDAIRGQEACRVSTAIDLSPDDLISDAQAGLAMSLLFGARIDSLLQHVATFISTRKGRAALFSEAAIAKRHLPWIDDVTARLNMALGAALTFRRSKQPNIVVAYLHRAEIPDRLWKRILALSAKMELPIIFVALPEKSQKKKSRDIDLSDCAQAAGVPGIPVDANDAVALYRVAQESMGRTRAGDGPVLIDCIADLRKKKWIDETNDPVLHMKNFLIDRKVCSATWANHAGDTLRKKIAAVSR